MLFPAPTSPISLAASQSKLLCKGVKKSREIQNHNWKIFRHFKISLDIVALYNESLSVSKVRDGGSFVLRMFLEIVRYSSKSRGDWNIGI